MEEKAIRGVPWTIATYAGTRFVGVISTVILARLLVPEEFGLVAIALLAVSMFNALRDFGLAGTLVLRPHLDERADGTVFTMMVGLGALLALVLAALSGPIAAFFEEPELDEVLIALSAVVAISSVAWFYEAIMQRELEFRRRFLAVTTQSVVYAVVAIALAALGAGVWSLVVGQLAGGLTVAAALFALAPYRVPPAFDRGDARSALSTGRGFLAQGGLWFVQQNADYLAVGRVLGATQTGYYSMAYRMSELPYFGVADAVVKVTFPGFARMRARGEDPAHAFLEVLRLVAIVTCPIGVLLSATADPFTRAVFGAEWLPMIGPLAVLGIWAAVRPVQGTTAWFLNSVGEAGLVARLSAIVIVPLVPALVLAADAGGITAVAWVMLADMALSAVMLSVSASRRAGVLVASQWRALRSVVAACAVSWPVARGISELMAGSSAGPTLIVAAGVGAGAYALTLAMVEPGLLSRALAQARRTLARETATPSPAENPKERPPRDI